jgi:hypothetical protein
VDLKSFNTLFDCVAALNFPNLFTFHDFIDHFLLSS